MNYKLIIALGATALFFTACTNSTKNDDGSTGHSDTVVIKEEPAEQQVIVKEVPKADETANIPVIASKQIAKGVLNVTKVRVVGSILNVEMAIPNTDKNVFNLNIPPGNIYYIDDATAKKNTLLKDDEGKFMVTPTNDEGQKLWYLGSDDLILISLKFAAPPAESKTISLTLGEYGSFDELPVSR